MKTTNLIFWLPLSALAISACAPPKAAEPARTEIAALPSQSAANLKMPLIDDNLSAAPISACSRLEEISNAVAGEKFSYMEKIAPGGLIAVNIAESPFVQMYLGEKFTVDSDADFLAKIEAAHKAGVLPEEKYQQILGLHSQGKLAFAKMPMLNAGLEENFPGIFGAPASMNKSLAALLFSKSAKPESLPLMTKYLTAKTSLFPADRSWKSWAQDVEISQKAAAKGFNNQDDSAAQERVCALVLYQRTFAQLLRIKGYTRISLQAADADAEKPARIAPLSPEQPEFLKESLAGAMVDPKAGATIELSAVDLNNYHPAKNYLNISELTPSMSEKQNRMGKLSDSIAFFQGMLQVFISTNPELDVAGEMMARNRAIVPADMHALALGMMNLQMKNIAGLHIKKINSLGSQATSEKEVASAILASEKLPGENTYRVNLRDILALTQSIVALDKSLLKMLAIGPAEISRRNPVYTEATLAKIYGPILFSKAKLMEILKPEEFSSILIPNLKALKFPLALLAIKMAGDKTKCVAAIAWDLNSGKMQPLAPCSLEDRQNYKQTMAILAQDLNSPMLLKRSQE